MHKPDPSWQAATLIIAAHGSSRHPGARPVHRHVEAIRQLRLFTDVQAGFLKEKPLLSDVLAGVDTADAYVVPMVTGNGFITDTLIPDMVEASPCTAAIHMCEPVGNHPMIVRLMVQRIRSVLDDNDLATNDSALLLAAHGNTRNPEVAREASKIAAHLSRELNIECAAAFIEEAPFISDWPQILGHKNIIVLPFLVGGGFHGVKDLPHMLGLDALDDGPGVVDPVALQGRTVFCCPAIGNEPAIADIIIDRVNSAS
ncbi:MAG: CbiX/SirB N-terminal domain-containing protein [Alphaproteobacteria bacterium]